MIVYLLMYVWTKVRIFYQYARTPMHKIEQWLSCNRYICHLRTIASFWTKVSSNSS